MRKIEELGDNGWGQRRYGRGSSVFVPVPGTDGTSEKSREFRNKHRQQAETCGGVHVFILGTWSCSVIGTAPLGNTRLVAHLLDTAMFMTGV